MYHNNDKRRNRQWNSDGGNQWRGYRRHGGNRDHRDGRRNSHNRWQNRSRERISNYPANSNYQTPKDDSDEETKQKKQLTTNIVKSRLNSLTVEDKQHSIEQLLQDTADTVHSQVSKDQEAKASDKEPKRIAHVPKPVIKPVPPPPSPPSLLTWHLENFEESYEPVISSKEDDVKRVIQDLTAKTLPDLKKIVNCPREHDNVFLSSLMKETRVSLSDAMRKVAEHRLQGGSPHILQELENLVDPDMALHVSKMPVETIQLLSDIFNMNLDGDIISEEHNPNLLGELEDDTEIKYSNLLLQTASDPAMFDWHTPVPFNPNATYLPQGEIFGERVLSPVASGSPSMFPWNDRVPLPTVPQSVPPPKYQLPVLLPQLPQPVPPPSMPLPVPPPSLQQPIPPLSMPQPVPPPSLQQPLPPTSLPQPVPPPSLRQPVPPPSLPQPTPPLSPQQPVPPLSLPQPVPPPSLPQPVPPPTTSQPIPSYNPPTTPVVLNQKNHSNLETSSISNKNEEEKKIDVLKKIDSILKLLKAEPTEEVKPGSPQPRAKEVSQKTKKEDQGIKRNLAASSVYDPLSCDQGGTKPFSLNQSPIEVSPQPLPLMEKIRNMTRVKDKVHQKKHKRKKNKQELFEIKSVATSTQTFPAVTQNIGTQVSLINGISVHCQATPISASAKAVQTESDRRPQYVTLNTQTEPLVQGNCVFTKEFGCQTEIILERRDQYVETESVKTKEKETQHVIETSNRAAQVNCSFITSNKFTQTSGSAKGTKDGGKKVDPLLNLAKNAEKHLCDDKKTKVSEVGKLKEKEISEDKLVAEFHTLCQEVGALGSKTATPIRQLLVDHMLNLMTSTFQNFHLLYSKVNLKEEKVGSESESGNAQEKLKKKELSSKSTTKSKVKERQRSRSRSNSVGHEKTNSKKFEKLKNSQNQARSSIPTVKEQSSSKTVKLDEPKIVVNSMDKTVNLNTSEIILRKDDLIHPSSQTVTKPPEIKAKASKERKRKLSPVESGDKKKPIISTQKIELEPCPIESPMEEITTTNQVDIFNVKTPEASASLEPSSANVDIPLEIEKCEEIVCNSVGDGVNNEHENDNEFPQYSYDWYKKKYILRECSVLLEIQPQLPLTPTYEFPCDDGNHFSPMSPSRSPSSSSSSDIPNKPRKSSFSSSSSSDSINSRQS